MGKMKNEVIKELETPPTCGDCGTSVGRHGTDCDSCQREMAALADDADREIGIDRSWKDD